MSTEATPTPDAALAAIIASAQRLGMELDSGEAQQWLAAIQTALPGDDVTVDENLGVFGHKIVLLDFSPAELAYFRQVGDLVEIPGEPGVVECALALSGSAAQSKIQSFPGDCDYFQRVNIIAPTREDACRILARLMRDKAIQTGRGRTYQLIEIKFGSYPRDMLVGGRLIKTGSPVSWQPEQVRAGEIQGFLPDDTPIVLRWDEVAGDPGWCKLDWIIADPTRGRLANASNMLDVTWETPDGQIIPLDGYLDPYFQEVYLESESIPIFSKLAQHVSSDALDHYVGQSAPGSAQVSDQGHQLRQSCQADVQHLPPDGSIPRGRVYSRVVRRARHHALSGLVADPHGR